MRSGVHALKRVRTRISKDASLAGMQALLFDAKGLFIHIMPTCERSSPKSLMMLLTQLQETTKNDKTGALVT